MYFDIPAAILSGNIDIINPFMTSNINYRYKKNEDYALARNPRLFRTFRAATLSMRPPLSVYQS